MDKVAVMSLSTLGDFAKYSPVFYRVYVEKEDGSRVPIVVATNLGPLAPLAARLVYLTSSGLNVAEFFLGFVTPMTLTIAIANSLEDFQNILANPRIFLNKVSEELVNNIRSNYEDVQKYIKENREKVDLLCKEINRKVHAVTMELSGEVSLSEPELVAQRIVVENENEGRREETGVIAKKIKLIVHDICSSKEHEYSGYMGLSLVPQTGRYSKRVGAKNIVGLFREKHVADVRVFNNVLKAAYIRAISFSTRFVHSNIFRKCDVDRAEVLIDTTHGLNIATTMLMQALRDTLPLIKFELYKALANRDSAHGKDLKKIIKVYLYNSDPVLGLRKQNWESLNITVESNVSYYFTLEDYKRIGSIGEVIKRIEDLIFEGRIIESKDLESLGRYLEALYLISRGLVVWGLYVFDTYKGDYIISPKWLSISIRSKDNNTIHINLSVIGNRERAEVADKIEIGAWLTSLARDLIEEVSKAISANGSSCWDEVIEYDRVKCYDFEKLMKIVNAITKSGSDPKGYGNQDLERLAISKVTLDFLREVIENIAKVILSNEVGEWLNNATGRVLYFAPPVFSIEIEVEKFRKHECSQILRTKSDNYGYYYLTPMKVQIELRNILAHAGLTAVHRFVAIAFKNVQKDSGEKECKASAFCIAAPFPREKLKELRNLT
ncbi:MAG: hypothetical protein GXO32_06415 [Crenarchaeota archaeon]|nr:hypothetical protein [Thermoproteota archaeon]